MRRKREVVVPPWLGYYELLSALLRYRVGRMLMGVADSQVATLGVDQRQTYRVRLDAHILQTRDRA